MPKTIELDHNWEFCQEGLTTWMPAQVPGHVHLDLYRNRVIPHPYQDNHEAGCQWVDQENWTFRCHFNLGFGDDLSFARLQFEGLDTVASIYLNEVLIGTSDNMFVPVSIDISGRLYPGLNSLEVRFQSAVKVGQARRQAYFEQEGIDPQVEAFDERAFIRKAPYMSGWDWGPRLVSCGIWKPVRLILGASTVQVEACEVAHPIAQLVQTEDPFGTSFEFHHNGKRLWIRGANWIPDTSFPSELHPDRLRKSLDAYQSIGINMLRVWGGGIYESDLFYELCLERNILVWQDFIFACSYYPESEEFLASVEAEARSAIIRLRKHPNLVLWCGNNENSTMWDSPWHQGNKRPSRFYGQVIYDELLPRLIRELDPDRPYIPSSPTGGERANDDGIGDSHVWDVWHGRGDWRFYEDSKSRFASEFGFASAPCLKTWKETISEPVESCEDRLVRVHDKTLKPWETFRSMVELHYPKSVSLEDWIYYSQLNQRDAMRCALEHFRRSDFCSGTLIWQANDCWPVQSWSLFDSKIRPKAAAYELKRLHDDLLFSIERQKSKVQLHGINDSSAQLSGVLQTTAWSTMNGNQLNQWEFSFSLDAGARQIIGEIDLTGLNTSESLLEISYLQHKAFRLITEPKLARLAPPCSVMAKNLDGALQCTVEAPVMDMMLTVDGDPSPFVQNFVTFPTAGTYFIPTIGPIKKMEARSLAGSHLIVLAQ